MGAHLRSAVSLSHLRELPPEVLDELLAGSTRTTVPAGSVPLGRRRQPHLELVVAGVVRVYVTAPDGRTLTVRYCRPGALIGVLSLYADRFAMPATTQAWSPRSCCASTPPSLAGWRTRDLRVARRFCAS